jgi:hypothetical protein
MKIKILALLLIAAFFSSCCNKESIETARYELSEDELNLIPYEEGQKINFEHSNGYEFCFEVVENRVEWKEHHDFCEWGCCGKDYFSYQVKYVRIKSSYPKLNIEFSVGGTGYGGYLEDLIYISVNSGYFASIMYDSLANFICTEAADVTCYDSVNINGNYYYGVVEKDFESGFAQDSTVLAIKSLLYNKQHGLIQLEMTNNETYSINN